MGKRHLRLTAFKLMATVLLVSVIVCNGREHGDSVEILSFPPPAIKVLTGSTVELQWRFRIGLDVKMRYTTWYSQNVEGNIQSRDKIIRKNHQSGEEERSPGIQPQVTSRTSCTFTSERQVWTINCRITNVNVYDSAVYGIRLDLGETKDISNTTKVEVVDIMFNEKESDSVVQSWINRTTKLTCAVYQKMKLDKTYDWKMLTEEKDISHGIWKGFAKTTYAFKPLSKRDFGKYQCTIRTDSTTVEHVIVLQQIDYAQAPRDLKVSADGQDVHLFWQRPLSDGGAPIIKYVVQTTTSDESKEWNYVGEAPNLSVKVDNIDRRGELKIRVCSRNRVGIGPLSCTETQVQGYAGKEQRSSACSSTVPVMYLWLLMLLSVLVI